MEKVLALDLPALRRVIGAWRCLLFSCLLGLTSPGWAFTTKDVNTAVGAYNSAFYKVSGTNGYFTVNRTNTTDSYFWSQAEMIETFIDGYEWSSNSVYQGMITNLLNGFISNNGSSWTWNGYNDDIMWATLAFLRGGIATGQTNYCIIAKTNFDACYARAWDLTLGGGLYWTTGNSNKNAAVNGPAAIAAYMLYQFYGDTSYYNKATNIYFWERATLFDTNSGLIADNISTNGVKSGGATTYNQGTFIGAGHFLGQTNDATLALRYTMMAMGDTGILPQYAAQDNNSGFNAIFNRWANRFVRDRGLQNFCQPWFQLNADAAWNVRRNNDQLSWCRWLEPTPQGNQIGSWDCISSISALLAANPTRNTATYAVPQNYVGYWPLDETSGTIANDLSGAGNNGSLVNPATWATGFIGGCLTLYGSQSNSYVQLNNPLNNDFTISLWVKTTQDPAGATTWTTGKGLVSNTNDLGTSVLGGKFAFGVGNPSTTIQSTTSIRDGNWHHCVATRQQTTGIMSVYVDGALEATGIGSRNTLNASSRLLFGAVSTLTPGGGFFNGSLDDIKIFSRTLSSNEVYALYASQVMPPAGPPTNLDATAGDARVTLTWSDGDGATSYNVKRSLVDGGPYLTLTNVSGASFTDTTATNGRSYYYVVSSVNAQGESAGHSPQAAASPWGLVAWFRADTLGLVNGSPVNLWPDASGLGYQAIQNVAANCPTYVTSALNGQPAVRFNATNNSFLWLFRPVQDDFTIIILFRSSQGLNSGTNAVANGAGLISGVKTGVTDDFGMALMSAGRIVAAVGNPETTIYSNTGFNDGNPHVATFKRSQSTGAIQLYVDGNLVLSGTGGTQSLTAPDALVLGGHPTLANFLSGDIAEVQIYNRVLPSGDQLSQERAIRCRYGLPGGLQPSAPTSLVGTAGNRTISLNWALSAGASTYNVWRSTNNGASYQQVASGLTTGSFTDINAANGQTNYYQVAAGNNCGVGGFSSVAATLLPLPALALNPAPNALTISWPDWANDWTLYTTTNLTPPVVWLPTTNTVVSSNGTLNVTVPAQMTGAQFYKLVSP
jgi:hypothetical protein